MGMGASNVEERVAASIGQLEAATIEFKPALDVPHAGVLLALPALLVSGLLRHTHEYFQLPKGYYRLESIFLLLAVMALARLKSVEALRYCAPGEWGKVLGLDRVPEVRTLRHKLALLSEQDSTQRWSAQLCEEWMGADPQSAATLYIDGHVRVYHGQQTPLPKHYVARQKLCLRATADYWVNAMDGQPFLVVHPPVDPGLIQVLEHEIVPRLETQVPKQPSAQYLEAHSRAHCFTLVFDREGYSPAFFQRMKQRRIACISYRKRCPEDWAVHEFEPREVQLASGQRVLMRLAERGVLLGEKLWVREIRKLSESGHQTAIVSTDYVSDLGAIACAMFARWSQENFFKYMREHYALDRLVDYHTEAIPDTTKVVNPAHRKLDGQVRRQVAVLTRMQAKFGALNLSGDIKPARVRQFEQQKAELQEHIASLQSELHTLKAERKATARHIPFEQLPEEARFDRLRVHSKHLIDTIKMIAYRAETAMAQVLRQSLSRSDDARSLLRGLYATEADLLPDESNQTLTVRLHRQANASTDTALQCLCDELNSTKTVFPGTNLRLVYELVSAQNRRVQEV
jgi:cell division protein FtsB